MRTVASSSASCKCIFNCVHACKSINMHVGSQKEKGNKKFLSEVGSGIRNWIVKEQRKGRDLCGCHFTFVYEMVWNLVRILLNNQIITKIDIRCMHLLERNDIVIFLCVSLPNWGCRSLILTFIAVITVSDIWQEIKESWERHEEGGTNNVGGTGKLFFLSDSLQFLHCQNLSQIGKGGWTRVWGRLTAQIGVGEAYLVCCHRAKGYAWMSSLTLLMAALLAFRTMHLSSELP